MRCCVCLGILGFCAITHADEATSPGLGTSINSDALEDLPRHVFADGSGLPAGSGEAKQGQRVYSQHCSSCHGTQGQGGRALELVGDRSLLASDYPDRGIAVYWPNAPTLYEYIYRSMPPENPTALNTNEMYSLLAYLLEINELIPANTRVNADVLSKISMPNRDGFQTIGR